jgi:para-nitrobenzyl esterase
MYLFDFQYHYPPDPKFRATHGSETAFAFNTTEATPVTVGDPEARSLAQAVHASWAGFARDGNPAHDGLSCWTRYDGAARATTLLTEEPRIVYDPDGDERAAWDGIHFARKT